MAGNDNHGGTPAAWTLVALVLIGAAVSGVGVAMGSYAWIGAGAAVIVLGLVVGKVMQVTARGKQSA
ncbi:HGxxPAAW family protein [Bailinhaonella thermotolerans]|uniref:Uncharacterized protein n=1 Tax=Bailinhaonella thermotolerans TaxID=1070861 RepID=A0A3A4AD52_9ACTN|nr:HGxxPAAW family protein [Bailinhaonella thermotolerans]RJL24687.1 hypothetical protein D5H75_28205 [Bailinhaonella thermotolerans]